MTVQNYPLKNIANGTLVLDVWEGQLEIDEKVLLDNGVGALIIRLNDMNGGHHKDANFDKQWQESTAFIRCPYFVYNPWVSGVQNFNWLAANMPPEVPCVAIDIELAYPITPLQYGAQFNDFIKLCRSKWTKVFIYTGAWFLPNITPWLTDIDYWWSQWPYLMYPTTTTKVTYQQLADMIRTLNWPPMNASQCPGGSGNIKLWQCSGDRLIIPGSTRIIDINIFPGTPEQLRAWLGYSPTVVPKTIDERMATVESQVASIKIFLGI